MTGSGLYGEVPYSKYPYVQTHPDRLATLAVLHGLRPAAPAAARVLELGCGAGGNLIPMAYAAPALQAVGVDYAGDAVADGRATAAALGLENVTLHVADVRELEDGSLGGFDFVIAHGVYGWVSPDVRDALLAAIAAHLAPHGVAFVSYAAYPGGYFRRMLREMALFHARDTAPGVPRAEAARELFGLLAELRAERGDPYGAVLARELPRLLYRPARSLVHDDLADELEPVWFAGFAAHAAAHGLAYMSEVEVAELRPGRLPEGVEPRLRELAGDDRIALEQYVDFLLGRKFRQSLLVRADGAAPVFDPAAVHRLRAASAEPEPTHPDPLVAPLVRVLARHFPEALAVGDLRHTLGAAHGAVERALWAAVDADLVALHVEAPVYAETGGPHPRASALARLQARDAIDVTSLRHENVRMEEPAARRLLTLLDGTRDRAALLEELAAGAGVELEPDALDASLAELGALGLLHE
jgi:SAM-dependent methyltransferase